jgi:hypothetical protein
MRDYARVSRVVKIETRATNNGHNGLLTVTYADGAVTSSHFASYNIMIDWVRDRRSWRGAVREFNGDPDIGYLTKPGTIAGT